MTPRCKSNQLDVHRTAHTWHATYNMHLACSTQHTRVMQRATGEVLDGSTRHESLAVGISNGAHPFHIYTGIRRAHPSHICTGTALAPPTSASGLGSLFLIYTGTGSPLLQLLQRAQTSTR